MRIFLSVLSACLIATTGGQAQTPGDPCRQPAEERAVHEALLVHFKVAEGSIEIRPLGRALSADRPEPAVASAVADFNTRNGKACRAIDGPVTGLSLLVGSLKTRLSRVGFDPAGTTAFAEVTMIGDPETGSGHYVVLRKDGRTWKVTEDRIYKMF